MKLFQLLVCAAVLSACVSGANADEKGQKGKKKQAAPSATARFVAGMDLTAEQKTKISAIDKEFAEKVQALNKKRSEIVSRDQMKAQREATQAAKDAGKSAGELRKAGQDAMNLTPEQKEKLTALQREQTELNGKIVEALKKVLTPEQQEKLPQQRKGKDGGNKKNKGKKKKAE
ncbi:MAG: hypothetical protein KDA91_02605 [Planctomycetaceae bacterium]|nr:hypothetical protein [Planctomycetaceae bacterium]